MKYNNEKYNVGAEFDDLTIKCIGNEKNEFGIVNAQGEIVVPFEYDDLSIIKLLGVRDMVRLGKVFEKEAVFIFNGSIKTFSDYDYVDFIPWIVCTFAEDENKKSIEKEVVIFSAVKDDKVGLIDWEGNVLLPCDYDWVDVECRNSKIYFLTGKGKLVKVPRRISEGIVVSTKDAFEIEEKIEFCDGYIPRKK